MTTPDTAIAFDHVAKHFRVFASPLHRIKEALHPTGKSITHQCQCCGTSVFESPTPSKAGERRRVDISFELTAAAGDLFIDLSVFGLDQGSYAVLDAHMGAL